MPENSSVFPEPDPSLGPANPDSESDAPAVTSPRRIWRKLRLITLGGLVIVGSCLLSLGLVTASAGWYTSRSEFCYSCHIMEPYYQSWERSTHSDVTCIKCHFPPGAAEKVRGKMLGLVQLAKYVTRSQGPRPTADIPDESCLRSGCHDRRNLGGHVDFHGIPFDHTPHLNNLRHGKELRCTSCHGMLVQGHHMSVSTATCFLCHFKDSALQRRRGGLHPMPSNPREQSST